MFLFIFDNTNQMYNETCKICTYLIKGALDLIGNAYGKAENPQKLKTLTQK